MTAEPLPRGFRRRECFISTPGDHWRLYPCHKRPGQPEAWEAWTTGRGAECRHRGSLASCIEFVRGLLRAV